MTVRNRAAKVKRPAPAPVAPAPAPSAYPYPPSAVPPGAADLSPAPPDPLVLRAARGRRVVLAVGALIDRSRGDDRAIVYARLGLQEQRTGGWGWVRGAGQSIPLAAIPAATEWLRAVAEWSRTARVTPRSTDLDDDEA